MVVKNTANDVYTFEQLNDELNDLYKYLKENKLSDEEISNLFKPLTSKLKTRDLFKYSIFLMLFVMIFILICIFFDDIYWHFLGIARIILIKMLPFWDWRHLKNEKCLVAKFVIPDAQIEEDFAFNCNICETIDRIDAHKTIDPLALKMRYIDMDIPVILTKPNFGWPQGSQLVGQISSNKELRASLPCSLASNLVNSDTNAGKLLERTELFDSFFIHFRNCELDSIKNFRSVIERPKVLHPEFAPIQSNWFLWSRDYNVSSYKVLDLVDKVAVIGQIDGSNYFKLVPRLNCEEVCHDLYVKLEEGEALIMTSLWNLEYRPKEKEENVAVILETH